MQSLIHDLTIHTEVKQGETYEYKVPMLLLSASQGWVDYRQLPGLRSGNYRQSSSQRWVDYSYLVRDG